MASVTFSIPEEVKQEMKEFLWVNWSELAREEALKKLQLERDLEKFKKLVSKSKFTESDADELAKKVKEFMHKQLENKGLV